MGAPFVYRPPLTANHYPQAFSFPYPAYPAQQRLHTAWLNPLNPGLRPPNILPSYSYPGTHRFPIPLPAAPMQAPRTLQVDERGHRRGHRRWSPPPRSLSVPAEHEQRVQNPPSPHPRAALDQRHRDRLDNPWNAGEPNWRGEQWQQNLPRFPGQQRQGPRVNGFVPFGNALNPTPTMGQRPTRDPSAVLYINSWISAPNPSARFIFDLSSPEYAPRVVSNGRELELAQAELMQPATSPPSTRMRVFIDAIPQWPCEIVPHSTHVPLPGGAMSPITLRDVLRSLYEHLHQRISSHDWAQLGENMQQRVTRTFTKRCNRHDDAPMERSQGVKRVDFLLKETKMVGLWWVERRDGCDIMKLILQS